MKCLFQEVVFESQRVQKIDSKVLVVLVPVLVVVVVVGSCDGVCVCVYIVKLGSTEQRPKPCLLTVYKGLYYPSIYEVYHSRSHYGIPGSLSTDPITETESGFMEPKYI